MTKKETTLNAPCSLTSLGRLLNGKRRSASIAQYVADHLDDFVAKTREAASEGRPQKGYRFKRASRPETMKAKSQERRLEATLFWRYALPPADVPARSHGSFLESVPYFAACQTPLFDKQVSEGWGKIDLVGVTPDRYPAIVELKIWKGARGIETPLRALLEGVAYAIALRKQWPVVRKFWSEHVSGGSGDVRLPRTAVIVLGTEDYWVAVRQSADLARASTPIADLIARLSVSHDIDASFATINASDPKKDGAAWDIRGAGRLLP